MAGSVIHTVDGVRSTFPNIPVEHTEDLWASCMRDGTLMVFKDGGTGHINVAFNPAHITHIARTED